VLCLLRGGPVTTPCFNCHGAPYTTPWPESETYGECRDPEHPEGESWDCFVPIFSEDFETNPQSVGRIREWLEFTPAFLRDVQITLPSPMFPEAPECPAEEHWPEPLREARPEAQVMPWWVRGNFERLRSDPLPVRVDIREAQATARIQIRPGASLPLVDGFVFLSAGSEGGEITGRLAIVDNEIQLLRESLLQFHDLTVEVRPGDFTGSWLDISLGEVTTGDFGGLHLIGTAPTSLLFFIQPFMVPVPQPGFDWPSYRQWVQIETRPGLLDACFSEGFAEAHVGACPQLATYPDRSGDIAPLDLNVMAFLPPRLRCQIDPLLDRDGRLPQYLSLEDLLELILHPAEDCPAAAESRWTREQLEDFFAGAELEVQVQNLEDLYAPGRIDLGESHLLARLSYSREGGIQAEIPDFEIQLDPMGYPDSSETPSFRILGGRIAAAEGAEGSGIRLHRDSATGDLEVSGDLHLSLQLEIPWLGEVWLEARIYFSTLLARTANGFWPVPGFTTLHIQNLEIQRPDGSSLAEDGEILLSDDLDTLTSIPPAFAAAMTNPNILGLRVAGRFAGGHELFSETVLQWRSAGTGAYVLPAGGSMVQILRGLPLEALDLAFQDLFPDPRNEARVGRRVSRRIDGLRGELHVRTIPPGEDDIETGTPRFHGEFSADRIRPDPRDPGNFTHRPVLRDGIVDFEYIEHPRETPVHEEGAISLAASLFDWSSASGNRVELHDLAARLSLDRLLISEDVSRFRLPTVRAVVNPHGSPQGRVRGPIHIDQSGTEGLEIVWNSPARTLELSGLDLIFSAQGLDVFTASLRRTMDPRVASLGLDGHLSGDFVAHLPEDRRCWNGTGDLGLRGDSDGDVYFLDARGRRVGAALFRDTRWRSRRVAWINWERGYALGDFELSTLLNPSGVPGFIAVRGGSEFIDEGETLLGRHGVRLLPYELSASMVYDNQPFTPEGFRHRYEDYILNLFVSPEATLRSSSPRVPAFCREMEGERR